MYRFFFLAVLVCSSCLGLLSCHPYFDERSIVGSGALFKNTGLLQLRDWGYETWPKFLLGMMYEKSQDLVQGGPRTVVQYRLAAEQGDARAQFILALLYTTGHGVSQDRQRALQWYDLAFDSVRRPAERADVNAQLMLGLLYSCQTPARDYQQAAKWFQRAAEQGDMFAQLLLANMYNKGTGVPESHRDAFKWYTKAFVLARQAAAEGDMVAQLVMGLLGTSGIRGGDRPDTLYWNKRAARQGNSYAQWAVGSWYVGSAPVEATKWWLQAAMQGDAEAQYLVGNRYYRGRGLPQDYVRAHVWLNLADRNRHHKAALLTLERLSGQMTPGQLADAQMLTQELIRKNPMLVVEDQ